MGDAALVSSEDIFEALMQQDLALLNRFKDFGANFEVRDESCGYGVVLWTVVHRKNRSLKWLLERRAVRNIQETDSSGWSALHYAARFGSETMVQLLLAHGADANLQTTSNKKKPADVAKTKELKHILKAAEKHKPVTVAVDKGSGERRGSLGHSIDEKKKGSPPDTSPGVAHRTVSVGSDSDSVDHTTSRGKYEILLEKVTARDRELYQNERILAEKTEQIGSREWMVSKREKDLAAAELQCSELKRELENRESLVRGMEKDSRSDIIRCTMDIIQMSDIKLFEQIGKGGFSTVYRATWRNIVVAVKVVDKAGRDASTDARTFEKEVSFLARLRFPHIISVLACCLDYPDMFMVMPLMKESLSDYIHSSRPISAELIVSWAYEVASAVAYLHLQTPAIIHRDLKPSNVLLDAKLNSFVSDLGLVRFSSQIVERDSDLNEAGSSHYMAPECLRSEPYTELADVWSYGVILWEMATREKPWRGMRRMDLVAAVGYSEQLLALPSPSEDVPAVIVEIMANCFLSSDRRSSITSILRKLNRHMSGKVSRPRKTKHHSHRPKARKDVLDEPSSHRLP